MSVPGIGPITATAVPLVFGLSRSRWRPSGAAGTSPPGSARCRASTRPAAGRGRPDIEDGPARSETAHDHGRHGGRPLGGSARPDERPMARQDAGAQAAHAGRGGAGHTTAPDRSTQSTEKMLASNGASAHIRRRLLALFGVILLSMDA